MSADVHRGIGMTSERTRLRLVQRLRDKGIINESVLQVISELPRHIFVDEALASRSYDDTALPIGFGQTISQPYIVARMTEVLLSTGPCNKVLEIGTGSGYQAAVLSKLVDQVFSVERISGLLNKAKLRFSELGLRNIRTRLAGNEYGWASNGPYDAIILTAAPQELPTEILLQLAEGGRLLAPVGPAGKQELVLITKTSDGFEKIIIEQVSFVPLLPGGR